MDKSVKFNTHILYCQPLGGGVNSMIFRYGSCGKFVSGFYKTGGDFASGFSDTEEFRSGF